MPHHPETSAGKAGRPGRATAPRRSPPARRQRPPRPPDVQRRDMPMPNRLLPPRMGGDSGDGQIDFDQAFGVRWGMVWQSERVVFRKRKRSEVRNRFRGYCYVVSPHFLFHTGGKGLWKLRGNRSLQRSCSICSHGSFIGRDQHRLSLGPRLRADAYLAGNVYGACRGPV